MTYRAPWLRSTNRNRHGRGMRRPMFGTRLPHYRTASGMFDDMVAGQLKRLGTAWPDLMKPVEFAVEDVPPSMPTPWDDEDRTFSQGFPSNHGIPARIVLYRMPLQMQTKDRMEMQLMIRDELVMRLAQLYGRRPEEIDPSWGL
ncbi:metallopeptidase family protein [Bifidobacterium crudilactis]|uniref:Metallopeptidase family protein n=1 Tax=Bifidobacterium crudilactis TaxID=327277 RepID=A0A971D024_9BIFI|nr:metallopeptidase family protein [Bifidobacterium crudilactis]MCI1217706.1 metallopeptidase family protein [Bifidobacterium crudilactis]MCI1637325.1 metallopeptidase family protein [Bifidobacterium crudilactis]MCI1643550.1 metallopeptidase family protein [Bifidobacterium crudilactis]MCI1663612.1 metallopeptidase family protein [Bifidobacterium crudilactis]MCI1867723.1 metallopeptidase family protein [Bifidobacterium crudilactis]